MYLLTGKEFDNLRNRVVKLGAKDLQYSRLLNKTCVVTLPNNKKNNFGDKRYKDFTIYKG